MESCGPEVALTTVIDGRTLQGLLRQKRACEPDPTLKGAFDLLTKVHDNIAVAKIFHQNEIFNQTQVDIDAGVDRLASELEPSKWPSVVVNNLLSFRIMILQKEQKWDEFVEICDAWAKTAFDLKRMCVASLPNVTEAAKVSVCSRVLFREGLYQLVSKGQEASSTVKELSKHIVEHYCEYDPIDLTVDGLRALKEYLCLGKVFMSLVDFELGLKYKDIVREVPLTKKTHTRK